MTTAIDSVQKNVLYLVQFQYGDYTLGPSGFTFLNLCGSYPQTANPFALPLEGRGGAFVPTPSMEVVLGTSTGTLAESLFKVALPLNVAFDQFGVDFADAASNGEPFSPIIMRIWEQITDPLTFNVVRIKLFEGRIIKSYRNYQGRSGTVMFEAVSIKNRLQVPLGLQANNQCVWIFGQRGCNLNIGGLSRPGTVTAITGKQLTVTGLSPSPAPGVSNFWSQGNLYRNGVRISIRFWDSGAGTSFLMASQPPASWIGQVVVATPGCDKTLSSCINSWSNVVNFGGMGYAIPSYHPVYEGT